MTTSIFSITRQRLFTVILLANLLGLAGCTQAASNPAPNSRPAKVAILESRQQPILESSTITPTADPAAAPSLTPTATPKTVNPTRGVPTAAPGSVPAATSPSQATTAAPLPIVAATATGDSGAPAATQQPVVPLIVSPPYQALPAGSSAMFRITTDETYAHSYTFQAQELPDGVTAEFLGDPTPWKDTLVLHTAGTLAPGSYTVRVSATQKDTALSASTQITLDVTGCSEFPQGEFTQAIQSNFITLITAGKPAIEHGLLVPLQVCQNHTLRVTLTAATSEANTPMAEPPRFYLYRSLVWPAPGSITAHGGLNVRPQRSDSNGWVLQADVTPGLYLLVFERDRWTTAADPDPSHFPAAVSYRLEAAP